MSLSIQTNVNSLVAQENLRVNSNFQAQTIQRLTSGYRINSSADDAAGLAVANKFRSDTVELSQGVRNASDATAQLQIMDGGTNNISQMLDRMRTLATQSASATYTGDRGKLNTEFQSLTNEIDRQAQSIGLTVGGANATQLSVYIGGGKQAGYPVDNAVSVDLRGGAVDATSLGLKSTKDGQEKSVGISTATDGSNALALLDQAQSRIGEVQAQIGKGQNQLSYAVNLAQSQITNFSSAQAQIRDADIASEAANLSKAQVLQQASMAAMAQANSAPQAILSLLRG
ncbi:MAG TPA: flagellin [Holophaga sp.]|nr:flagellin [Holophaga sp.]HPS67186.1 flagellin [Holophaga sp.]